MDDIKAKHSQSIIDLQDKERDIAGFKTKLLDMSKELKEVNKKYDKVKSTLSQRLNPARTKIQEISSHLNTIHQDAEMFPLLFKN